MKKDSLNCMKDCMINDRKMKILILGNAQSMWVKEFIQYVLLTEEDNEIFVTSKDDGGEFADFYKKEGIHIIKTDSEIMGINNAKIRTVLNMYKKIKLNGEFDIIHVHYVPTNIMSLFYSKFIFKFGKKVVLSFWGSDLLQEEGKNKWQESCIKKSDYITVSGSILKEAFFSKYKNFDTNKLKIVKFGISVFPYIDETKKFYTKDQLKSMLGLSPDKTLISIGYNARESQQHLKVAEQLSLLSEECKQKISAVLQFGTGISSPDYKEKLEKTLKKASIEYTFTEGFLDKKQTAILRAATDIFIHAQETDALSASVQEYLYSGAYVINPVWINYKELKDIGVSYKEYDSFEQLPTILEEYFADKSKNSSQNRSALLNFAGWEEQKRKWWGIYK